MITAIISEGAGYMGIETDRPLFARKGQCFTAELYPPFFSICIVTFYFMIYPGKKIKFIVACVI